MENEKNDKKYKEYVFWSVCMTIAGAILLVVGFLWIFWGEAKIGLQMWTFQRIINNGSFEFLLGIMFLGAGVYKLLHRKQVFKQQMELEEVEEMKREIERKNLYPTKKNRKLQKEYLKKLAEK